MGKAKAFLRGVMAKLTSALHVFKPGRPPRHHGTENSPYSVVQGPGSATEDTDTEQSEMQPATAALPDTVSDAPGTEQSKSQSTMTATPEIASENHGTEEPEPQSPLAAPPEPTTNDSGTEQPVLQSDLTVLSRGRSMLRYVIANFTDGSSKADYDSDLASPGQQSEEGRRRAEENFALERIDSQLTTTRRPDPPDSDESAIDLDAEAATRRSIRGWLEAQILEPRPPYNGHSEIDYKAICLSGGLLMPGLSDPSLTLKGQLTPEQRQPLATNLEDPKDETPTRWSADYDQFSSDGKQRKVEQVSLGHFELQPRSCSLNTPLPRPGREQLKAWKLRGANQSAGVDPGLTEETDRVAAQNAAAQTGNAGPTQIDRFEPVAAHNAQIAMEAMHRSFQQVEEAYRQFDFENQAHWRNMRWQIERNNLLQQELDTARAAVRERDAEIERLRGLIYNASQTLRAARHPNSTNSSVDETDSVIHHSVVDPLFSSGELGEEGETDMYGDDGGISNDDDDDEADNTPSSSEQADRP
ncbi:uncharacterized protein A1O5_10732 [Cladophialophora psammophila CBS 110553]|uniref:Uncharacterized protein n=1 Tax=Cladophialophora psammophila CBS 110553 TaxID=1182543 RepID=W9WDC7_9EURO|nr:uncharacterized protein A1O5_10732 [Cladophialophora psammophila CBS 110553]EXJ66117.1 hypothetical protein A1O5_10732 [Cladophialophora psammophila CBS 110553]